MHLAYRLIQQSPCDYMIAGASFLYRFAGSAVLLELCKSVFYQYFIEIQLSRSRPRFFYAFANCYKHRNDMFGRKTNQFGNFFKIKSIQTNVRGVLFFTLSPCIQRDRIVQGVRA
jgi:hypothetical protein